MFNKNKKKDRQKRGLRPLTSRILSFLLEKLHFVFQSEENKIFYILDLFSGFGTFGIGLLTSKSLYHSKISRLEIILVEKDFFLCLDLYKKIQVIKTSKFYYRVLKCDATKFFFPRVFDIVFMDPPYKSPYLIFFTVKNLITKALIDNKSLIIIKHHINFEIKIIISSLNLKIIEDKKFNFNVLTFLKIM